MRMPSKFLKKTLRVKNFITEHGAAINDEAIEFVVENISQVFKSQYEKYPIAIKLTKSHIDTYACYECDPAEMCDLCGGDHIFEASAGEIFISTWDDVEVII